MVHNQRSGVCLIRIGTHGFSKTTEHSQELRLTVVELFLQLAHGCGMKFHSVSGLFLILRFSREVVKDSFVSNHVYERDFCFLFQELFLLDNSRIVIVE